MSKLKQFNGKNWEDVSVDGLSAYEIWLSEGNRGTKKQFLESIKGEPGAPGKDADETAIIETIKEVVTKDSVTLIDKEFDKVKRHIRSSKTINMTDIPELQSATTGQVPAKQADGTWAPATISGGAISDGDKGDITVSGSGATWTIDDDTIGLDELSATGTPSSSTFLRGDNTWATPIASVGNLTDIGDVTITTPADNEVLAYDTGTGEFINQTPAEAGLAAASHTHTASEITDFDTEVSNNTDVAANTSARHDAVTVLDSSEIDFTLTGQQITASLVAGSIDETKLDASVNASLTLAGSASQPGHTHTESDITDLKNYEIKAVANGSLTAALDTYYVCVSNSTFTDPSPVEGEGYAVFIRNGTATIGGTGYSTAGTIIHRIYHSGAWASYEYLNKARLDTTYQPLDADLTAIAALANTDGNIIVGNGSTWVAESGATARTSLGLGTGDSPQFTAVNIGNASDTTVARVSAGQISVEGVQVATASNTLTLTNKTLTSPSISNSTHTGTTGVDLITYDAARGKVTAGGNLGATETVNFNDETNYTGTLDSNITFTFANATSGDEVTLFLSYDGTAQRTITWPTITWLDNSSGAAPATPAASGNVLVVTVRYIGTTFYASATGNYAVYA